MSRPSTPEEVLARYWGYPSFRSRQREIIQSVLDGRDTLGLLPTGGGQSIPFQVPSLLLPGRTVAATSPCSPLKESGGNCRVACM